MTRFRSIALWRKSRQAPQVPTSEPDEFEMLDEVPWPLTLPNDPAATEDAPEPEPEPEPEPKTKSIGKIEVYRDAGDQWRWRMVALNGQKFAVSGEAFASKANAKRSATRLSQTLIDASSADVVYVVDDD